MSVVIDITDQDVPVEIGPAADWEGGNRYTVTIADVEISITHEQLETIWKQVRPWFEDDAE